MSYLDPPPIKDMTLFLEWLQDVPCMKFHKHPSGPDYTIIRVTNKFPPLPYYAAEIYYYNSSNVVKILTTDDSGLPVDIPTSLFETDPDLHWTTDYHDGFYYCMLCAEQVLQHSWCSRCMQKRSARRAGIWWLLVAPLNADLVGYIARVFARLAAA